MHLVLPKKKKIPRHLISIKSKTKQKTTKKHLHA